MERVAQEAEDLFQREYPRIEEWFRQYDALHLLSFCQFYFLAYPEGVDPEVRGPLDFYFFYLEILQAFSLMQERSLKSNPVGPESDRLLKLMGNVGTTIQLRAMGNLSNLSEAERNQRVVFQNMRSQTASVRNWGYAGHMHKVNHALAEKVRMDFLEYYSVDPATLVDTLLNLAMIAQDRLNQHLDRVRSFCRQHSYKDMAKDYVEKFPDVVGFDADRLFDTAGRHLDSLKALLVFHSDLRLKDNLTFTLDDIVQAYGEGANRQALNSIFDKLSMQFGELRNQNKEHVILDNPVWGKPFIKLDHSNYFSALIGSMPHYTLGLLERLISEVPGLEEKYRSRKARYLEDELEKLFRKSFPSAQIYCGSMWDDGAGSSGENDLTAIVDCVAVVVEAKSGLISPPASRGARERFKRTVRELIEEPAEQANRFISLLKLMKTPHAFRNKRGSINTIDASKVRYFVPLTITLEQFGSVSNLRDLVESGISNKQLTDLAPVISMTDLMVIFEILDLQSEKIHYLARRREIDAHLRWHGDELDIFTFYLENGFNIGETEFSGEKEIDLLMASKVLDPYFVGQESGVSVPKPELALTRTWRKMLRQLDLGKGDHWLESAIFLLNVAFQDQQKFDRRFEKLCRKIKRGKTREPHNWVVLLTGPPQRRFFLAFYPHIGVDRATRNSMISGILGNQEAKESRGALCVGINLDETRIPYSVIAMAPLPELFEKLHSDVTAC